ncbi:MAG: FAD-dependent oxidoreductase [Candidatus Pacebacteria bacterium]|nr:FAD-dependent oxidoreductase [Candidatus Paceibacterota bacterium]
MEDLYDLIIIGGGPAGISAGIYASRQNLKTLLLSKSFGGQMTRKAVNIENYPGFEEISGFDLIQKFERQLRRQKIDIRLEEVTKLKKSGNKFLVFVKNKQEFSAKTVIVATGADPRPLEAPGEKKFIGRGVSYCTACDGPIFKDKSVSVIGGGNSGFEAAIFLSEYAKKVYILECGKTACADETIQKQAKATKKIEVITGAVLKRIQGQDFVDSIIYENLKTKELEKLDVQGVFIEIGSQPATSFLEDLVDFNKRDEIIVDPKSGQTKTPGLFSAGDVDDVPYKQIVIAAGEGAKAALSAYNYIKKF